MEQVRISAPDSTSLDGKGRYTLGKCPYILVPGRQKETRGWILATHPP